MVIQTPASKKAKEIIRKIQLSVLEHFKDLPPNASILKIEVVQAVFVATPIKPKKKKS
jgi:hypothetical protein